MTRAIERARRRLAKAGGKTKRSKQKNQRPTLWSHGEFVAIDGEGFSDGPAFERRIGQDATLYRGKGHSYAYLASSDGAELYADRRLSVAQCLEFLCDIQLKNPLAILVAFGASYDVLHFFRDDFDADAYRRLVGKHPDGKPCIVTRNGWTYKLDYRPRKCLSIQRWREGARRWDLNKAGKRVSTPHLSVRVWDVWGFFQDSFVGVLTKWVPGDPDFEFVQRMKGGRSLFERDELGEIRRYNAAELRLLVKVMNRVRDAINDLGLKISRWDGAGAVAAAMMSKHEVRNAKAETPDDVFDAARRAYSGGHIEACKIGHWWGRVFHYDINSAYPDQFRRLPDLSNGVWTSRILSGSEHALVSREPPAGYTLVKVEFAFPDGLPFYPLFYRQDDGTIFYPPDGVGWYWFDEFDVARKFHAECVKSHPDCELRFNVTQWFHFREHATERPFGWVADYYNARQDYIRAARAGGFESGPEKIIKLGLNALYGKTAQQVGAREDATGELRLPPYFQLDWAGFVTAGCRARMMEAALQDPGAVIMFATDGLFTTRPLDLDCPAEKVLGAWEAAEHDGITVVMPGVYWLHDAGKSRHYSRGFDKAEMADCQFVIEAWKRGETDVSVAVTRMVGIGSATGSPALWELRGCFCESRRLLSIDGDNSKRYGIGPRERPAAGLVPLAPRGHFLPNRLGIPESAPYPIAWLDDVEPVRDDAAMNEWLDEIDAELV